MSAKHRGAAGMRSARRIFAAAGAVAVLQSVQSQAATIYWDGTSASWNLNTNWSTVSGATTPDPTLPPGASDAAIFNITTANSAEIITLDGNQSANSLTFNSTGNTTLIGGGTAETLTLGTGGITIASGAGAVTFGDGTAGNNVLFSLAAGTQTWTNNSASNALTINDSTAGFTRMTGAVLNFNQASTGTFAINTTTLPNTNSIVGPWAFFGTGANTKYAVNNSGTIAGLTGTAAATGGNLTDTTGTANYDLAAGGGTVPATVSANTIRYTGGSGTTAPGATSFTVNGLTNAGTGLWTIGTNAVTIGSNKELVVNTANSDIKISGPIKDNGVGASSLTKTGSGTLTIAGQGTSGNEFTGTLAINQGTVHITSPNGTAYGYNAGIVDNASLILDGQRGGNINWSQTISGNGSLTLLGGSGDGYDGIYLGSSGSGTSNSFTGGLTVSTNAQFRLFSDASLGATGGGITLDKGQIQFHAGFTIGSTRTITLASGGGVIDTSGNNVSFGGTITGNGSLTKMSTGNLTLSGANSGFSGYTSIIGGTLTTGNASALGTGQVALGGGTLNLNGTALTIDSLANALGQSVTISGGSGYSLASPFTFTGGGGSGAAGYDANSTSGTLSNGGTGYTSVPTISGGGGSGGTLSDTVGGGSVTLGNGTLTLAGTNASPASFNGSISGTGGSVIKKGSGTQIFTGSSSYTGGTTISAGTLLANSSDTTNGSTGTGTVTVAAGTSGVLTGGRLGGGGVVKGNVSLATSSTTARGGIIAAGADDSTIGVLNNSSGNETWAGGAAYEVKFAGLGTTPAASGTGASGTPGTSTTWDEITMNGLDLSSAGGTSNNPFTIALHNLNTLTASSSTYSWVIAQSTTIPTLPTGTLGALSSTANSKTGNLLATAPTGGGSYVFALDTSSFGSGFTVNGGAPTGAFSLEFVNLSGNYDLVLDYAGAPEPGTATLVVGALTPMLLGRRRRKHGDRSV